VKGTVCGLEFEKELEVSQHISGELIHKEDPYPIRAINSEAGYWWLMPVKRLLSGGLRFKASPGKDFKGPHVKKKKKSHKSVVEKAQGVGTDFNLQCHHKKRCRCLETTTLGNKSLCGTSEK
jgi:hypothetical protein